MPARQHWLTWACLAAFAAAALAVRLWPALNSPGAHRPDEVFQVLEPAHRLWSGWGVVSWEWRDGIRSWLFPGLVAGLMAVAGWFDFGPEGYMPLVAAALSVASLGVVATGMALGWRASGRTGAVLCGVLCGFWPELAYFAPRTLSEVQAGNLLTVAAGLASLLPPCSKQGADGPSDGGRFGVARSAAASLAGIGALLGLVACLRFQLAPAALAVALWAGRTDVRRRWAPLLMGGALPLALLGACDWATWGSPFQSVWKNVAINLVQHRSETYGVQPPGWYLVQLSQLWGGALPAVAVCFALGVKRAPLMAAVAAAVVGPHSLVAHKEISFVYAALPPVMVVAGIGTARGIAWTAAALARLVPQDGRGPQRVAILTAAAAALWTVTAVGRTGGYRDLWSSRAALMPVWLAARQRPDLCGLGLYGPDFPWHVTGGYAYLHRPVPIYLLRTPEALAAARPGANYLMTWGHPDGPAQDGYVPVLCANGFCLARREQACSAAGSPQEEINAVLVREGA